MEKSMKSTACILDTETTGLQDPALLESAVLPLLLEDGYPSPSISPWGAEVRRYDPGKPIEFGAMATHHITQEEVQGEPSPDTFSLPDGTQYIVGHNIDFDWAVIGKPPVKRICTLAMARRLWPEDSHKQTALLYKLIDCGEAKRLAKDAHSAGADVEICLVILRHIVQMLDAPITSWEDLYQISEEMRIPTHMPFGKHKGELVSDIPLGYVSWLRRQEDIDPYLLAALDRYHGAL